MFGFGPKIDATKISEEVTAGTALLVDVRRDDEWASGHATGAIHLPIERINAGEVPTKDTSKKIYLYCLSGGRAGRAAQALKQNGFDAESIGGLSGWQAAGGSIE